jgi:hypothetical protein
MAVLVAVAAVVVGGRVLWSARALGYHYMGIGMATTWLLPTWGALELVWALTLTVRGVEHGPADRMPGRRPFLVWCVLVELLVLFMVPVHVNFAMFRTELETQVRSVQSGATVELPVRLGAFEVDRIGLAQEDCRGPECEVVLVLNEHTEGEGELVWTRDPERRHLGSASNGHLSGPWYWSIDE